MKTAVSIPDSVFRAAERHAARLRISRSKLYSQAVEEYLARYSEDAITAQLNEIYATESSDMDPGLKLLQVRALPAESWK